MWAYFMKKVWADRTLGIDPKATMRQPEGFDDCETSDTSSVRPLVEPGKQNKKQKSEDYEEHSAPATQDYE
jgi:hypothetical protein